MLNGILAIVARWTVGKKLLGAVAWTHEKLDGKKSEILLAVYGLIHLLKIVGVIDPLTAAAIEEKLVILLPVTLADRASKIIATVDKVLPSK
jgi:hypothetical protein